MLRPATAGGKMLEWLERCILPAEAQLNQPQRARLAARDFCEALIGAGTTCALIFGSQFPLAQEALFEELEHRRLRAVTGRTVMTRGPPSAGDLVTSEEEVIWLCQAEIERWHPAPGRASKALLQVALTPRFTLSMRSEGLRRLGELYAQHRRQGLYVSTHLGENNRPKDGEVAQVLRTFPVQRCLDTHDGRFLPGSRQRGRAFSVGGASSPTPSIATRPSETIWP